MPNSTSAVAADASTSAPHAVPRRWLYPFVRAISTTPNPITSVPA